jgi:hypothetical protein
MDFRRRAWGVLSLVWLVLAFGACRRDRGSSGSNPTAEPARAEESRPAASAPIAGRGVQLLIAYGSEKKDWLEEQVAAFNATSPKLSSGEVVTAAGKSMGSGEAMQNILSGRITPAVFSPASTAYITLINDLWLEQQHTSARARDAESIVISPIVIAMWRPMAEGVGLAGEAARLGRHSQDQQRHARLGGVRQTGVGSLQARSHPPGVLELRVARGPGGGLRWLDEDPPHRGE